MQNLEIVKRRLSRRFWRVLVQKSCILTLTPGTDILNFDLSDNRKVKSPDVSRTVE